MVIHLWRKTMEQFALSGVVALGLGKEFLDHRA